jgi:hypothetical protein
MIATMIPPKIQEKKKLIKKNAQKLRFLAAAALATSKDGTIQKMTKKASVPIHSKPVYPESIIPPVEQPLAELIHF